MDAIDFAYGRLGRFIRPGSNKTAWLEATGKNVGAKAKKFDKDGNERAAGDMRFGVAGCTILITEGECTMVASAMPYFEGDYSHIRFLTPPQMGERYSEKSGLRPFMLDCRFSPPEGQFMLLELSKTSFPPQNLVLNLNGRIVYSASPEGILATRNAVIARAFEKMAIDDVNDKTIRHIKHVSDLTKKRLGGCSFTAKETSEFNELKGSPIVFAITDLIRAESLGQFFDYLRYLKDIKTCKN